MAKVTNDSGKTVSILRWKVLPDGRIVSPMGELTSELPADVAYSAQAKHLADQNIISIQGYGKAKVAVPVVEPEPVEEPEETEEDDDE